MDCPRCKTTLTESRYENQIAMLCKQCTGSMVKQRNLTFILERLSKNLFSSINIDSEINTITDKGPVGQCPECPECPECSEQMEHYGYMSKHTMVDFCQSCNWLWIDPGEFIQMATIYLKSQKKYEHIVTTQNTFSTVDVAEYEETLLNHFLEWVYENS